MRMIRKTYTCEVPGTNFGHYKVHAWMAPGAKAVNIRVQDGLGFGPVEVHRFDWYRPVGQTMDDLVEWLYYVVKA
jgi:hypothetical protein